MPSAVARRRATAVPRARLSREQVVDAALELVDADGLEALTLRKLAVALGVTPMALYWHVADKDALLDAVGERLYASVRLPDPDPDWQTDVGAVCHAIVIALSEHPAAAPLALPTALTNEAGARVAERVLSRLVEAGLPDADVADLGVFLLSSLVSLVVSLPTPAAHSGSPERAAAKAAAIAMLPPAQFPVLQRLAGRLGNCQEPDAYLRRGVELLMLGLRSLVAPAS